MSRKITVALAGNPNSGKTTIFNNLTGLRRHVGNYPGVTVEKKEGRVRRGDLEITVVDLPGTYSLTAYSVEELTARNFLIERKPDVVIDVVDASNLERNLYLAVQLMELDVPLVLAFNMADAAKARGLKFDLEKLSGLLGAPIVSTVAVKNRGLTELLEAAVAVASKKDDYDEKKEAEGETKRRGSEQVRYGREVEREIERLRQLLRAKAALPPAYSARWTALKLLENDQEVRGKVTTAEVTAAVEQSAARLKKLFGDSPEIVIADRRYGFISGACQEAVRSTVESRHTMSDKLDVAATSPLLGPPLFLLMMYLIFQLTFTLGDPLVGGLEHLMNALSSLVASWWPVGSESALKSLLLDGIIGGVGAVLVFLPNIMLLFMAISFMEDTGYMARAAFITDRLMHKIGLHGKSFIPLLLGFGCTVPALMATRILENRRDRLTTMLIAPLMSCGARLPIYALIIPAFFAKRTLFSLGPLALEQRAFVLWSIYLIGIVLAVFGAKLLRSTLFKGETTPLVMELPPYRLPTLKSLLLHMWEPSWMYLKKAGTIIFSVSVILWVLNSYPKKPRFDRDYAAESNRVEQAYLSGIKKLNPAVGLPPKSPVLAMVLQAKTAEKTTGAAQTEERQIAAKFLQVKDAVTTARRKFAAAVEEHEARDDSPEYLLLEQQFHQALTETKRRSPAAYAAAVEYLDHIETPYREAVKRINGEKAAEAAAYSAAGRLGRFFEPVLHLMGFDWRIGTALVGAFAAKEVFVAQMGIVYSVEDADEGTAALRRKLAKNYDTLTAFCIMLFCLIGMPCIATFAVTARESGSWKWAVLQNAGLTFTAFVITTLVFQLGLMAGLGGA